MHMISKKLCEKYAVYMVIQEAEGEMRYVYSGLNQWLLQRWQRWQTKPLEPPIRTASYKPVLCSAVHHCPDWHRQLAWPPLSVSGSAGTVVSLGVVVWQTLWRCQRSLVGAVCPALFSSVKTPRVWLLWPDEAMQPPSTPHLHTDVTSTFETQQSNESLSSLSQLSQAW